MPCIALWYDARVRIEPRDLLWDSGNVAHIARHGVTPQEVEEVASGRERREYREHLQGGMS